MGNECLHYPNNKYTITRSDSNNAIQNKQQTGDNPEPDTDGTKRRT